MSSLFNDWSIELFPSEQKLRRRRLSGATASQPASQHLGDIPLLSRKWQTFFRFMIDWLQMDEGEKRSRNFNVFSSLFLIGGRWSLAFILLHFVLTMKKINKIVSMKLWRLFDHFVSILLVRLSCCSSSKKSWQRWFLFETSEDFRRPLRFPGKPAADL